MIDFIRGLWRLFQPIKTYGLRYPFQFWNAYYQYYKSLRLFKRRGGNLSFRYLAPILYFRQEDRQSGGGHYFYQDTWALRQLARLHPLEHYDIGSRFDGFIAQATAICPITCIDIRQPVFRLPDFTFVQGDILKLPFADCVLKSLSCLHTIEHIGLGRYGDEINPNGFDLALTELQRVLAPSGYLLLSMPIGRQRIEFNAQRILDPMRCIIILGQMKLIEFSVVTDSDEFISNTSPALYSNSTYACGLYLFQKF